MRPWLLLGLATFLVAAAPTPPEPPPEKKAVTAPQPPEKPAEAPPEATAPVPPEKPAVPEPRTKADEHEDEVEVPAAPEPGPPGAAGPADTETGAAEDDEADVPVPPELPEQVEEARDEAKPARPLIVDTTEPLAEAACRIRLKKLPAEWQLEDPIRDERCGIGRAIRLTRADGIALQPAATLNCRTAEELTLWLRDEVVPAAESELHEKPKSLLVAGSYVCRNRNGRPDGKISEHAFGNAIDVSGFVFDDETVPIGSRDPAEKPHLAAFQKHIRKAACERFTTVLGPGTNTAHRSHFHLDLRQRSHGYRLCE